MNAEAYRVGGLLYAPAGNANTAVHVLRGDWPCLTALALCLEDSTRDSALPAAERQLQDTLGQLSAAGRPLPQLFVRVRTPAHLVHVHSLLGETAEALTGYVLPKLDEETAPGYLRALCEINKGRERTLYAMPILESAAIARAADRRGALARLRELLEPHRGRILNIRVGANDLLNAYGLRRTERQTIYDMGPVRDMLSDIASMFAADYVVAGPVWEYFGPDPDGLWARGLRRELELDHAYGFIGKTAIHPAQLPIIRESMRVARRDYEDARRIAGWTDERLAVVGGSGRMNELKCHSRWTERTLCLAELYGVTEEDV